MKTSISSIALSLMLSAFVPMSFAADKNTQSTDSKANQTQSAKSLSMTNLIQQLQNAGYTVKDAQFNKDDGTFKIEAFDKLGEKQSFDINSKEGIPSELKNKAPQITLLIAVKKIEKPGVTVKSAGADGDGYKVVVLDNTGNEVTYKIDMKSGQVTKG